MTIEEKICQIMLAEELSGAEKLDSLYALIPPDVCKIDNLNQATPAALKAIERWFSNCRSNATAQSENSIAPARARW